MKEFLFVLTLTCFCFASGGDTITYTDDVKNLADGEPFYSDLHYHSMKDSIAKVVNGGLGNINLASDAQIELSKLDTAGVLRGDTLRNKKVNTDTVKTKIATADSTNSTAIKTTRLTADSATIPILKGNVKFAGACTTTTHNTDSIKINGGSYLNAYITGSFPCTLKTIDVTVQQLATAYWTKVGDVFTCSFPRLQGTSNSTSLRIYCRFPYKPKLFDASYNCETQFFTVRDNNVRLSAYADFPDYSGYVVVFLVSGSSFTNSGIKGVSSPFTIRYITEN